MVDISVIVPVYNSEKYILKAVKSILCQSFVNFEVILVDDGSTDSSGKLCDELKEKDNRIRVVHTENQGICAARNRGLDMANGRYIAFCDNDDLFLEDLFKDNIYLADKYNADVVRFSRRRMTLCDGKIVSVQETKGFDTCYIPKEKFAEYYEQIYNAGEGVWAGLYKKDYLDSFGIRFNESMKYGYEDLFFITQVYMQHPSVVLNSKVYYLWIMRTNHSTSAKTNINNIESLMKCLSQKKCLYQEYGMTNSKKYLWVQELSARICQVVKYVAPQKVDMTLHQRIDIISFFATSEVFRKKYGFWEACKQIKKTGVSAALIFYLFTRKKYLIVYLGITGKASLIRLLHA